MTRLPLWIATPPNAAEPLTNLTGGPLRWRAATESDARLQATNDGVPETAVITKLVGLREVSR